MSDVHINTSWSNIPSSDTEYNTVLGVAGYNADDERLFLSAQQVPNIARNITTEFARGFRITSGYYGIVLHDAITESSADLKTIRFTMSTAGSSYDLNGARLYAQFKNLYSVDIGSWALYAEAEDETQTLIAAGNAIAAGTELQVDFINDYGAVRFILTLEYSTGASVQGWELLKIAPNETTAPRILGNWSRAWTLTNNTNSDIYYCAFNNEYIGAIPLDNNASGTVTYTLYNDMSSSFVLSQYNLSSTTYNGYKYYYTRESSILKYPTSNPTCNNQIYWIQAIIAAGGLVAGGLNTADLSNYTGDMWQGRLIANIANIYPSSMATESEGGENGDFDVTSDALTVPDLPAEGVTISPRAGDLYLMTESQFGIFQNAIYGSSVAQAIKALFNDVTNCILSVMTFPLPTNAYTTRFNSNVFAGGQDLGNSTECPVINRYIEYDCGTVTLNLFWDNALDLNPYTKLNIFIPAVGMRPIDADCCMGHTIGLKYHIDLLTGSCVAFVTVDGDVYQQHTGNIGQHMAFSGTNNGLIMSGVLAGLAGNAANIAENSNPIAGAGDLVATTLNAFKVPRSVVGNFSGNTAQLAVQKPYIEIIRPIQQLPRDYTKFNAYPCYMTQQLINLSGWTEVQDIFIDDIDCTTEEREQLLTLLRTGVIL